MKSIVRILSYALLMASLSYSYRIAAQDDDEVVLNIDGMRDTTTVQLRSIPASSLAPYLEDDAFRYNRQRPAITLPERVLRWIQEWIRTILDFLEDDSVFNGWRIIQGLIVIAGIWFVLSQLLGVKMNSLFYKEAQQSGVQIIGDDTDIRTIDFDAAIRKAIAKEQYRQAIRLAYLEILNMLSDRRFIDWQLEKTNHDYILELNASSLQKPFMDLTRLFEVIWYGDIQPEKDQFQSIMDSFHTFRNDMQKTS